MEFLEDAVIKAKEVFDVAYQKTSEAVSIGKQKYDIAATKNKMDKDFMALGKIYYSLIKDSEIENEKVLSLVLAINDKKLKIAESIEKINSVKNTAVCPNCEAAVDKNALFCLKCGAKLDDAE